MQMVQRTCVGAHLVEPLDWTIGRSALASLCQPPGITHIATARYLGKLDKRRLTGPI